MRLALSVIALAVSVGDARADRLVASSTNFGSVGDPDILYIHRIGESSITEIHHEHVSSRPELAWSDPRTLWVLTESLAPHAIKLQKFVDGNEVESASLAPADWKTSALITPVLLRVSQSGEVWLATCVEGKASPALGIAPTCKRTGYLRVDAKPFTLASKQPAFRRASTSQMLGDGLVATLRTRTLADMRHDPKPYDGLWKLERKHQPIGDVPGRQLLLAPR